MDEPIEERIKKAEPKGPFHPELSKLKFLGNGKFLTGLAALVVGYWMIHQRPAPIQPKPAPTVKQTIVEEPGMKAPAPSWQGRPDGTGAAPSLGVNENPSVSGTVSASAVPDNPIKTAREERWKLLRAAAFESNIVGVAEEKAQNPGGAGLNLPPTSSESVTAAPTPAHTLPEGTMIEAVLDSAIAGEMTGPVRAHVSTDVYVPLTHTLVLPQGTKLLGVAAKVGQLGQQRLAVTFHTAQIFQKDKPFCTIPLSGDPGLDQTGAAGIPGKVNNHVLPMIAVGAVVALIQGLSAGYGGYSGGYGIDPAQAALQQIGSGTAQVSARILDRYTNRLPTIAVPEGSRLNLYPTKDLGSSCEVGNAATN